MPNSVGMTGSKWFRCDRCGRWYPIRYKAVQDGLSVCTYLPCLDEPGYRSSPTDPRRFNLTDRPEENL